jgi:ATP/maltotriose-dependent transcriptional regulator MalT
MRRSRSSTTSELSDITLEGSMPPAQAEEAERAVSPKTPSRQNGAGRETHLLHSKLFVPCPRTGIVPRQRLIDRLNQGLDGRLTLISAPAGFGKSTLLTAWRCHTKQRVCWVSLDENDNNPARFWTYFFGALRTLDDQLGKRAASLLSAQLRQPHRLSPESFLAPLVNEISTLERPIALVLDDYHFITAPVIHEGIEFLLDHLPQQMHLIITSRADPPLPLARLRARNQLNELRARDLRFTTGEAASFLNEIMGLQLTDANIGALETRTEGWIVGLQFAALSMQGRSTNDLGDFITAFTGSHRFVVDYLAEEVFSTQPEQIRRFLLHTSILERLGGPLCDAVTGESGSAATLAHLERNNLFTIPLDEQRQWYRYHQLFADVLRHRLEHEFPELAPDLHRRASAWYEQNGFVTEAMRHALAAHDMDRGAHLIEEFSPEMIKQGDTGSLLAWLDLFPMDLVSSRPRLSIAKGWASVSQDRLDEARRSVADAEQWAEGQDQTNPATRAVIGEAAAIRATLAVMLDDAPAIVAAAKRALEYLPAEEQYLRGMINANLSVAYILLGDLPATRRAANEALRVGRAIGNQMLLYYAHLCAGGTERTEGHLRSASASMEKALEAARIQAGKLQPARDPALSKTPSAGNGGGAASGPAYIPAATLAHRHLGDLVYEWNDLEEAYRHANVALELGQSWWVRDEMIKSHMLMARVQRARGNEASSDDSLKQAEELTEDRYAFHLAAQVGLPRLREWLAQDRIHPAVHWGEHQLKKLRSDPEPGFPKIYALPTVARLLLAQEKPEPAMEVLGRLLLPAEEKKLIPLAIEVLVLQSLAMQAREDIPGALDRLNRALSLARPERYVRTFLDEGEPMQALLRRVTGDHRRYASSLLNVPGAGHDRVPASIESAGPSRPAGVTLIEPLSRRELELVPLLAEGLSNQEVARKAYISPDTVKVHLRHIYQKLGVKNRAQATSRARELGLL